MNNMNSQNQTEILLIEDNPRDAELTLHALRKRNLANNVVHLVDGAAALDYLFATGAHAGRDVNHQPRVMLLDLKLPKVDGLEVLRRVKADARLKNLPIVVLTSSREEQDVVTSYRLGVNSYIVKPVDWENFSKAVADIGCYWLLLNEQPPA